MSYVYLISRMEDFSYITRGNCFYVMYIKCLLTFEAT